MKLRARTHAFSTEEIWAAAKVVWRTVFAGVAYENTELHEEARSQAAGVFLLARW